MDQYLIHSTRNKQKSIEKEKQAKQFFRKKRSTDENQKNSQNYFDKINGVSSIQKATSTQLKKPTARSKKQLTGVFSSQKNIQMPPPLLTSNLKSSITSSLKFAPVTTTNLMSKDKNLKNLKIGTSGQLPKMLIKSMSQTTVNKKLFQDKKNKIYEKLGFTNKIQSNNQMKHFGSIHYMNRNSKDTSQIILAISQFKLGKKLGNGRFGNVYLAQQKKTGTICAIKILNKTKVKDSGMQDQVVSEIKLQTYMNHPNILKIYGFFHDQKNIYLILEYCSQCLFKEFRNKNKLGEEQTAYYVKQAISALKYMHNQSIMHRDIKPQNILIEHGVLKMSDFGWSIYSPIYKRQTFCGTVDYVPPEIVEGNSYDQRVDVWAVGILLYQLASGCAPFETKDQNITYEKIVKSKCKFPNHFTQNLKNLVTLILDKNPTNRPNLAEIENHQWFQTYKTVGRYISKDIWHVWNAILQRQ